MQQSFDPNNPEHVHDAMRDLYNRIDQLNAANRSLEEQNSSLRTQFQGQHQPQQPHRNATPKLPLPEKYDGKRYQFRQFLNSVKLQFSISPDRFPNDASKTGFVSSLLRGPALDWITPYLENQDPMLNSWAAFESKFKDMFDDPHRAKTAVNNLTQLRQGRRSVVAYAAEFRRIIMDANFDNNAKVYWFRAGLSDAILDELVHTQAMTDLDALISQCILIDTRLLERAVERKRRTAFAPPTSSSNPAPSDPMIIDATNSSFRRGPISADERKRRLEQNLCLYCGGSGHQKSNCSNRPGNGQSRQHS